MQVGESIPIFINYTMTTTEYGSGYMMNASTSLVVIPTDIVLNINSNNNDLIFSFTDSMYFDLSQSYDP
jgi:hypothetical protein